MPDHAKALEYAQPKTIDKWAPHLARLQEALVTKDGDSVILDLDAWLQEVFTTVSELVEQEFAEARKEQHEASWKAAIEAAARIAPAYDSRVVADHIRALPIEPMKAK